MKKQIKLRKKLNKVFKLPTSSKPKMLLKSRSNLHYEMLLEEITEYRDAKDLNDVADALGDILELTLGCAIEHGLIDALPEIYNRVHASNMTKLDKDGKAILNGIGKQKLDKTKPKGKIIKSKFFKEPEFQDLIDNHKDIYEDNTNCILGTSNAKLNCN